MTEDDANLAQRSRAAPFSGRRRLVVAFPRPRHSSRARGVRCAGQGTHPPLVPERARSPTSP